MPSSRTARERRLSDAPLALVVEDDLTICGMLAGLLQARGYRLAIADGFSIGFNILMSTRPALLVCDAELRGGNGKDLAQMARSMEVPVLLIGDRIPAIDRLTDGPTSFLQKPFRIADLELEMERLLAAAGRHRPS